MMLRSFVLVLLAACLARADHDGTTAADALRAEGVALFKQNEFAKAADKYREAIAAYAKALGKEDAGYLSTAVELDRAVAWCEAQSGDVDGLIQAFDAFYDAVLTVGGNENEEQEIRNCLSYGLTAAAGRKAIPEIDKLHQAYGSTVEKAIGRAKADPRGKELVAFIDRSGVAIGAAQNRLFERLCLAGETERGLKEYAKAVAFWKARGDLDDIVWTPQNAFHDLAQAGETASADFFLVETLVALRAHDVPLAEGAVAVNLQSLLAGAEKSGHAAEARHFLSSAIDKATAAKAFTAGTDEVFLRTSLDRFLGDAAQAADRLANAEALAKAARQAGNRHAEALADLAAGEALSASGKAKEAVSRLEDAVKVASENGDELTSAEARLAKGRALSAGGDLAGAEAAFHDAIEIFLKAKDEVAASRARMEGIENARKKKDDALVKRYEEELSTVSAAGGEAGVTIGDMEPAEIVRRLRAAKGTIDLVEVSRDGNRLAFKNLLDGSVAYDEISFPFHYVSVSGVLFEVRGPELLLTNIYDRWTCPGTNGDMAISVGGQVQASHGQEFTPFRMRLFVGKGGRVRASSSVVMYWVKE